MPAHLITGAGSGIGAAVARRLQQRGDDLWLVARSPGRAEALGAEFPGASVLVADLAEPATLAGLHGLPGQLDSIVHSAGVIDLGRTEELTVAQWTRQLTVNLVSVAELTRIALPALRQARGRVIFVNSGAGLHAHPNWAAYAASKHGLRAFADALRAEEPELAVTSVYPGRTATAMQQQVRGQEGGAYHPGDYIDPDTVAAAIVHALGTPRDAVLTELTLRPRP
ncbi:SDR family oxidoreductase [Longispora albida]|uniref:SDR family oxidoreductase n=1 Tax=Longispora albida TaxID=203523 RepID=UPI0003615AFA|nr:SDR family oxidoreductase [Longispora albida]